MEEIAYFFDTYAIIEIIGENKNYKDYLNKNAIFTVFNLAELYLSVLNHHGKEKADKVYEQYKNSVVEIDDETLKEAMIFKKERKKKNLSYADCIGYVYSKRNNMKFLTGDKEFQNLENVEFVK